MPTLQTLRERADEAAAEALEFAARLCMHRIADQRQLRVQAKKLDAAPWSCGVTRVRTHPEALLPGDLLRALLVCDPDRIAQAFGDDLRAVPWQAVVSALGSWSGPARRAPPRVDDFTLEIDPAWARRWALADVRLGRPGITVPGLLSAIGEDGLAGLAAFSTRHEEGLATAAEVVEGIVQRMPREVGQHMHRAVPPAYVDRHDGLGQLEAALREGPGALVVGARWSGRSELLRAWVRRATADGTRDDWEGRAVVLDPHRDGGQGGAVPSGAVVGLTAAREEPEAAVRWVLTRAGALASLRVALVVDAEAVDELRRVPALAQYRVVEVPPVDAWSRAAMWVAHTVAHPGIGVAEALQALHAVGLENAGRMEPWAFEQLVSVSGLLSFYDGDEARRVIGAGGDGQVLQLRREAGALERRVDPGLLEAIGGAEGLRRLQAIEGRLRVGS